MRIERGWVTTYSIELVECPKPQAAPSPLAAGPMPILGLLSWLSPSDAWAGHSSGTPNPAALRAMQVESLTDLAARELGTLRLAPQQYCKLHYLVARAAAGAAGLPSEPDMVDQTLHVEGTFRRRGESSETRFTIRTASAYGQLFEREGRPPRELRVDTGRAGSIVTVRRSLGRIFDGVDFAELNQRTAGLQVLRALVDHAEVEVHEPDGQR